MGNHKALDILLWETTTAQQQKISEIRNKAKAPAQRVIELEDEIVREKLNLDVLKKQIENIESPEVLDYDSDESLNTQERIWHEYEKNLRGKQEKRWQIEKKLSKLDAERVKLEKPLKVFAEDCAVVVCKSLTANVHASMPRELRDMIYDYLWDDLSTSRVDDQIDLPYMRQGEARHLGSWALEAPLFADANSVGEGFAREAATWYFRNTTAEVDCRLLRAYLNNIDTFGNMTFRPRDIMRRLTIDISWQMLGYYTNDVAHTELRENLETLLNLPVKEDFQIIIYLSRDMQFSRTLFRVLETLRPIYTALVQKGMKVKILGFRFFTPQWRNPHDFREEVIPERVCTTAEQMNYYFKGTPEEWLDMKEAELQAIKQPQRRANCLEIMKNMRKHCMEVLGIDDGEGLQSEESIW